MTRNDKPADVFQCEVEVVFDEWDGWMVNLRVGPRTRHIMDAYFNKPDALVFARRLARRLGLPVRVWEKK